MAKGVMKKVEGKKRKLKAPQSMALEGENQAEFEEKVAEMKAEIKKGTRKITNRSGKTGVVYVGCMPRGFHEHQMNKFFSQFGRVLKLRVSRSKKTGGTKGYAFVMFEYDEVARVVADTMNNYLMFQKLMKCRYMPAEEVHPELFKGCHRKFTAPKAHKIAMDRHNSAKSAEKMNELARKARRKIQRKVDRLAKMGIDYSLEVGDKTITAKKPVTTDSQDEPEPALSTPARQVLLDDSSDDEISMKTPPGSVRVKKAKSKLNPETKTKVDKTKQKSKVLKLAKSNAGVKSLKTKGRLGALGAAKKGRAGKGKKR